MDDRRDSGNMSSDEDWDQQTPVVKETGPLHLHYADFNIETPAGARVKYVLLKEKSLQQFGEALMSAMETEQRAMFITVDVLSAFIYDESFEDITSVIKAVTEAAMESGRHRIVWSTLRHSPDAERYWSDIGDLNCWIRRYTAEIGEQNINLHKLYLKPRGNQLYTFAEMYLEWWHKSSLGSTPSEAAGVVNAEWVEKHHARGFSTPRMPREPRSDPLAIPAPLGMTPDFVNDEKLLAMLKSRGLYRGRQSRSATRRSTTRKGSHRTLSRDRADSLVSGGRRHGGARTPDSVSALERLLNRVARMPRRNDPHSTERETVKVTTRIAELYREKCNQLTKVQLECESLRLELELVREAQDVKAEAELTKLRDENRYLREAQVRSDRLADKLSDIKEDLRHENSKLYDELQLLKMSKRERRAHKKNLGKK